MGEEPDMRWFAGLLHDEPEAPGARLRTEHAEMEALLTDLAAFAARWNDEPDTPDSDETLAVEAAQTASRFRTMKAKRGRGT